MARYEVAPTRTNLIRLRDDLAFAREGYELLEQKREILVVEMKRFTARAVEAQHAADRELAQAYAALKQAQAVTGVSSVSYAARAVNIDPRLRLAERRVMGVGVPSVEMSIEDRTPYYGPGSTSVWTDEAVARFKAALAALATLAEARIAVIRLAREIKKTIRRVNALEKILIPDCEETLKYVADSLEESDREAFFVLKLIKEQLESRER